MIESNIKTPRGMTLDGSLMRRLSAALGDPTSVEVSDGGTVEDGLIELAIEKLTAAAQAEQAAWHAGIHEGRSQVQSAPAAVAPLSWRLVPTVPTPEWIGAVADDGYADCDVAQLIASILSHAPAAVAVPDKKDARAMFERAFPVFGGVFWNGSRYEVREGYENSYRADSYVARWDAWQAALAAQPPVAAPFQQRVRPWLLECFGAEIAADRAERNHRFLEESLELVQALGCTAHEAHQLVDYVYGRPIGDPPQEVGGVMVTLAALCLANGLDMHDAGEVELARISSPEVVAKIRAKQAAKPKHSPLPEAPQPPVAVPTESCLIDGIAYDMPAPVAAELLRMHIEAKKPAPSHSDDVAVDALAALMKVKLAKQRARGYGGWDTAEFTQRRLSDMLRNHVDKGDPVDVANFCAFLSARGEGIAPQPAPVAREREHDGWYCAHCQRGVDSQEVTFSEQHSVCGRYIADDRPPVAAQEPVAWGAFYFGGKRNGKLYAHCDTKQQIESYIADRHQSDDTNTFRAAPIYTAPQQAAPGEPHPPTRHCMCADCAPSFEPSDDGWMQDGGLLYRLTDGPRPKNRDEINVTMADGSRSDEARARRAGELLDRIRAMRAQSAPAAVAVLNERFAFEVWEMHREDWRPSLERNGDGYKGGFAQEAWNGWKARAALYEKG